MVVDDVRNQVGSALEVLATGLAPFVQRRMSAARGSQWFDSFAEERYSSERSLKDPRFLLKVMTAEWGVFSPPMSRMERSLVFELKETGNRWAHYEAFTVDGVDRALDSIERLLVAVGATDEAATVRQRKEGLRSRPEPHRADPPVPEPDNRRVQEGPENWRLILAATRALTAAGQTPFTRKGVYEWIWERHPSSEHGRGSLDPTLQGMIRNAPTGAPSSRGGRPLLRVGRGLYILDDSVSGSELLTGIVDDPARADAHAESLVITEVGRDADSRRRAVGSAWPGQPIAAAELAIAGFKPLELLVRSLDVDLPGGQGCEWTTTTEVPEGPGLYAFTVEDDHEMRVTYVGRTEHLWMVTKGLLPGGRGRVGQRYGRPRHAGATRQRINILIAEQLRERRLVRQWVRPCPVGQLRAEEERLITEWDLRGVGWNRG